jgi:3-methyladenine DNA glycosylase/8-oxoguanine DNA glycosylase
MHAERRKNYSQHLGMEQGMERLYLPEKHSPTDICSLFERYASWKGVP